MKEERGKGKRREREIKWRERDGGRKNNSVRREDEKQNREHVKKSEEGVQGGMSTEGRGSRQGKRERKGQCEKKSSRGGRVEEGDGRRLVRSGQEANALLPILAKPLGRLTLPSLEQNSNASSEILVTLEEIVTLVRLGQYWNAATPMSVTPAGTV